MVPMQRNMFKRFRTILIVMLAAAIMGTAGCEKEQISEETKLKVAPPETSVETTVSFAEEKPEEPKEIEEPEYQEVSFPENIEAYAGEILEKKAKAEEDFVKLYDLKPCIIDRAIIKTDKGDLYHFHIDMEVAALWGYIVGETPEGVQTLYDYEYSARNRYNIYEGGYIQNIGESSAASWGEDLYLVEDSIKMIYSYESEPLEDYLKWRYERDFGKESNIPEKMKEAGMTDSDIFGTFMQRMAIGGKHIWLLEFYKGAPESVKNMAYDALAVSDISANVMVCREEDDFIEKSKAELKRQGYDTDKIFENLIVGERESWIWGETLYRYDSA